jgi:hypothetical protein
MTCISCGETEKPCDDAQTLVPVESKMAPLSTLPLPTRLRHVRKFAEPGRWMTGSTLCQRMLFGLAEMLYSGNIQIFFQIDRCSDLPCQDIVSEGDRRAELVIRELGGTTWGNYGLRSDRVELLDLNQRNRQKQRRSSSAQTLLARQSRRGR